MSSSSRAESEAAQSLSSLERELERVSRASEFSVFGHLWLVSFFSGYLNARQFRAGYLESSKAELLHHVKEFLDCIVIERAAVSALRGMQSARDVIEDRQTGSELKTLAGIIVKLCKRIARNLPGKRPVPVDALVEGFEVIRANVNDDEVSIWIRNSWRSFSKIRQAIDSETLKECSIDTAVDALVPTRYQIGWLQNLGLESSESASSLVSDLGKCLLKRQFTPPELSLMHDSFCHRVHGLPSVSTKEAANILGVSVDHVHRMTTHRDIDSFSIKPLIPKEEVTRYKNGIELPKVELDAASKMARRIVSLIKSDSLTSRELVRIQDLLVPKLQQVSFPLKDAIDELGHSKAHVYKLMNQGQIIAFGLPRLIPESEALRLKRDPTIRHSGRPRLSES